MANGRDIRIMRVEGVGKVSLISIIDVVSRLKAESYPSLETTNPALADYQLSLRRAFLTYGLPEALTLDHGTVFYDNTTPSPFPTRLHLWLLALGVQVRFFGLGAYQYYLGKHLAQQRVALRFDPEAMVLICLPEGCEETIRLPIQGITKAELMGELAVLQSLPPYQLALPFSLAAWRQLEYVQNLTGTTL
jgi:hypothetical protein